MSDKLDEIGTDDNLLTARGHYRLKSGQINLDRQFGATDESDAVAKIITGYGNGAYIDIRVEDDGHEQAILADLTPEQARRVADSLNEIADYAEENQ